jgi:hypothetical protein
VLLEPRQAKLLDEVLASPILNIADLGLTADNVQDE